MNTSTYTNNMIRKFIFRIDFINELTEFKENIPANITEKIKSNFPNSTMTDVIESKIQINKNTIEKRDKPFKQWEYISSDNSNKIVITPNFLIYDCSKYISFDDVLSKFLIIIEEIFKIKNIQTGRVGIRYVNGFSADEFGINSLSDWEKYFDPSLFSHSKFCKNQDKITNMVNTIEFSYSEFRIKYKSGFNNRNYPLILKKPDFTIDCDGYSNAVITSFDELKEIIENIHKELEKVFEQSITTLMRGKLNEK